MEDKTKEQLLKEKKEKFEADPDRFVDTHSLIVAVQRRQDGIAHMIGKASRNELQRAKAEVQFQIDEVLRMIALEARTKQAKDKKVIMPGYRGYRGNRGNS